MSSSSRPSPLPSREVSRAKAEDIIRGRRSGYYQTEETLNESIICLAQLKATPSDKVFTLNHQLGVFNVFDKGEFLGQMKHWKALKCRLYIQNIHHDRDFKEMGKATVFTITPPKGKDNLFCPLALCFGLMVSGFSYVTLDKDLVELCWRYLGNHDFDAPKASGGAGAAPPPPAGRTDKCPCCSKTAFIREGLETCKPCEDIWLS